MILLYSVICAKALVFWLAYLIIEFRWVSIYFYPKQFIITTALYFVPSNFYRLCCFPRMSRWNFSWFALILLLKKHLISFHTVICLTRLLIKQELLAEWYCRLRRSVIKRTYCDGFGCISARVNPLFIWIKEYFWK